MTLVAATQLLIIFSSSASSTHVKFTPHALGYPLPFLAFQAHGMSSFDPSPRILNQSGRSNCNTHSQLRPQIEFATPLLFHCQRSCLMRCRRGAGVIENVGVRRRRLGLISSGELRSCSGRWRRGSGDLLLFLWGFQARHDRYHLHLSRLFLFDQTQKL